MEITSINGKKYFAEREIFWNAMVHKRVRVLSVMREIEENYP